MSRRKLTVLDRINVPSPCTADWNEMKGNDVVRFCQHCSLNVTDLSSMTRAKATKLILRSKGSLCVRYIRKPDGAIQTATRELYQISRRASRITAGVFSAVLSLSATAFAQSQQTTVPTKRENIVARETLKEKQADNANAKITGVVTDPNGAVVASAYIVVKDDATGVEHTARSDDEGKYAVYALNAGEYTATIEAPGFAKSEVHNVVIRDADDNSMDVQLAIGEVAIAGGAMAISYENPLLIAVSDYDTDAVKEALSKKVNVNAKEEGTSALHLAVSHGNTEIVNLLLERGANPNIRDEEKQTPLMMIYSETPAEIIELLIKAGAKLNVKDNEGKTPLMAAAESGNVSVVQTLLSYGAKIDKRDNEGYTALMYAIEEEDFETVKVILAAGADINIRDNDGKTALRLAIESGNEEIIQWLKGYGAYEDPLANP